MEIQSIFVGINRHQDVSIPELAGARRDATSLWALFSDSMPEHAAALLVDERTTSVGAAAATALRPDA